MKTVKAVPPYIHPEQLNFKTAPYEAWMKLGGEVAPAHYPPRLLHGFAFHYEIPKLTSIFNFQFSTFNLSKEARLRFVEPISITFDTFPDYAFYEIIPFVWDCWPCYFERMCRWLKKHNVRTAIFTSSQTAERMRAGFPKMNIMFCPEAVDSTLYNSGKNLNERSIDLLEFGRGNEKIFDASQLSTVNHVRTVVNGKFTYTNEELYHAMGDAKVTITLPRSYTQPEIAGDIETLTQRYWECMLSRMVMVGHAPKELTDLIGYNPVIELDMDNPKEQILQIITHINDYQELVDKNLEAARVHGDWYTRMKDVMRFIEEHDYHIDIKLQEPQE